MRPRRPGKGLAALQDSVVRPEVAARRQLIASRCREARIAAGLSQEDVARNLGVHRPSVSEMENGNRRILADEVAIIAKHCRVSVAWLLGEAPTTTMAKDPRLDAAAHILAQLSASQFARLAEALSLLAEVRRAVGAPE